MKHERNGLLLSKRIEPQIDSDLYQSLQDTKVNEPYKQLEVPLEKRQAIVDAWHNGQDPDLSADHLDEVAISHQLEQLKEWERALLERDDLDPDIRDAYKWRIEEDVANVQMLIASLQGDSVAFQEWNTFIYGKPDELTYRAALDKVANDAEWLIQADGQHPSVIAAANNVLRLLEGKRGYRELLAPDSRAFEKVRNDHWREGGYYALLLAGVEMPGDKVRPDVGDPILNHVVSSNLESTYQLQDAQGAARSVTHSTEKVERPAKYNMPWKRFVGLALGHEIGSHLLEKENGLRGPLMLASSGFDRYEAGNEGRAVIREQVTYDTFDEFGRLVRWRDILRRHIAISYAVGVGEDAPQSSSKVYKFLNAIDVMYQTVLTPDDPVATEQKAQKKTDNLLLRVLKGTDGKGGAYMKDKVYLEGNIACWLTAALQGPDSIAHGDLGKFDINNPWHVDLLQRFGLLPDME